MGEPPAPVAANHLSVQVGPGLDAKGLSGLTGDTGQGPGSSALQDCDYSRSCLHNWATHRQNRL